MASTQAEKDTQRFYRKLGYKKRSSLFSATHPYLSKRKDCFC